jgi:hypothetical protein
MIQVGDKVVTPSKSPRALPWWTVIAIITHDELGEIPVQLFVLARSFPVKYIVRKESQLQVVATAETVARVREDLADRMK